jgi:hypothetical protein
MYYKEGGLSLPTLGGHGGDQRSSRVGVATVGASPRRFPHLWEPVGLPDSQGG